MKNVRKILITALGVMLLVCLGLFAAACDDGDEPAPAEKIYYTVTVAEYDATQGTVTLDPAAQDGKYEENTSVTVTATPNADYEVEAVKANGSALTANGEGKYVFTVSGDTTVAVTFKAKTVTPPPADEKVNVTVTCGSEGSYTLDPAPVDGQVAKGASVTLTVTPNANYEVDSVKVNGSAVTANGEGKYVFTANADTTVEITFKAQGEVPPVDEKVNVTVTCGSEGSYTLDPAPVDGQVAKGASVTLTVTPAENYEVDSVKVNNSAVVLQEGNTYTFTADMDTAISVTFKLKQVSLTVDYEAEQGSVTSDSLTEDGKVASGTEVTLTIEPAYGYEIVSVTVNGDDVTDQLEEILLLPDRPDLNMRDHSTKRTLALGAVTAETEVAVTFQQATHKITLNIEGPGSCELYDSTVSLAEQTELKNLTAVPSATKVHAVVTCESYVTAEFHVNDGTRDLKMSIVSGNTYFWVVDKDLTVTVTFTVDREKAPQHNVTVTGSENGSYTLTPKGGFPLEEGVFYGDGEATIKLTPNVPVDDTTTDTYIIDALKIKYGGSEETDVTADLVDGSYTFPVTGDVELVVSFKKFEAVTPATAYNGIWNCTVKGESSTISLSIQVSRTSILIKEGGITQITGKPYTATLGYTVYVEGGEDSYVIYLVPGLNNKVLSLTLNGDSVTYYLKSGTASAADATIEESESLYDSSWYGGAASMPIKFEFGKVNIDGVEATRLAKSVTEEGIVYTVYANGGLYELIWTEEGDSLVLHPYGKSTVDDVPYTRETPPDPVLVPQYAGTYSNNEHTVVIDAEGKFNFDGTDRNLYYEAQTRDYYFKTSTMEYTVQFTSSGMKIFNAAAKVDWTLNKIEEGTAQYTLTVNCENGTVAYSAKNAEMKYWAGSSVTITITANKHFEVEKITVNSEDKTFTNNGGTVTITVTMDADTTVDVTFKELKEENLLSDLYIGVYTSGNTTVTITATGVTLKNTDWTLTVTFTDAQITHTGEGQFTLQNGNKKFTFTFTEENTKLKVTDPNWAMGGSTKTLTKQP